MTICSSSYHILFKSCQCEKNNCCLLFCRWSSCEIKSSLASSCWLQFVEAWCWTLSNGCLARGSARVPCTTAWLGGMLEKACFFRSQFWVFFGTPMGSTCWKWVFWWKSKKHLEKHPPGTWEKMSPVPLFFYSPPPGATLESQKNELIIYCLVYPPAWGVPGGYLGG